MVDIHNTAQNTRQALVAKNLVAHQMPLNGIHLIEASAGTGKTYNITRIYLRLLLEQELTVQQILVMTFTKDATEELRGRIDSFIRLALSQWHELKQQDEYFKAIAEKVDDHQAILRLKQALLYLDEAAIFTIHGFCKRVLIQHAFDSGVAFNAQMEGEQQSLIIQAVQDWYRQLASDQQAFTQVVQFWPEPEKFVADFTKAINLDCQLDLQGSVELIRDFHQHVAQAIASLEQQQAFLFSQLVDGKNASEQEKRQQEFHALLLWLQQVNEDISHVNEKMPDAFIDGRRYGRSKAKSELTAIFSPVNQVKALAATLLTDIAKREALAIVKQGIEQIRAQVNQQKQQINLLTFDDLVNKLAQHLSSENGQLLADKLFSQYPYGLIDEFQDTDSGQLAIAKAIYYQRDSGALMMIGDPKQAIYGFRGGDIFAYMSARKDCDHHWLMDTNWRSTPQMITGYNRLFYGNALDQAARDVFSYQIPYHPVNASGRALEQTQQHAPHSGLHFVHFKPETSKKFVLQSYRLEMATWCANEIIALLTDSNQAVMAQDIALLVRDGTEANEIKQALANAGLASVYLSNRANLLHSEQTAQLIQILKGILFLENDRLFCASLASPLMPYPPERLYQLQQDDLAWQEMKFIYSQLRETWLKKGFITMALQLLHEHMAITGDDSERSLTNVLHLFELLQGASQRHKQPQELLHWFEQQSLAQFPELESELRLESEENLIRIITQHGSKGLEYPIVFVPFASRYKDPLTFGNRAVSLIDYHDDQGQRVLSLTGSDQAKALMRDEAHAESIRLLYVAITRAERKCYVLTCGFEKHHLSPIGLTCGLRADNDIETSLRQLVSDQPNEIALTLVDQPVTPHIFNGEQKAALIVSASKFNGKIERDWWLSSFTALSRNIRDKGISSPDRDDAPSLTPDIDVNQHSHSLRFALTKGANTGNLLHYIFEHLCFANPEWHAIFQWAVVKYGELPLGFNLSDLESWLTQVLATPLYLSDDEWQTKPFTLADLSQHKVLKESEFYFPLADAKVDDLSKLLAQHRRQTQVDEGSSYGLSISFHRYLKGMMHGFIDLVFEHQGKFYICDYKSNHLGDEFSDYLPEKLRKNIEQHHYDVQYLIYSLALHRYLKTSLPNYQVKQHFGGVLYLYLRGMSPQPEHRHCGVYHRNITQNELNALDKIFAGQALTGQADKNLQEQI